GPPPRLPPAVGRVGSGGYKGRGATRGVFLYSWPVSCDKNGWSLAYCVWAGNVHGSPGFPALCAQFEPFQPSFIIAESGYKTPSIAKFLLAKAITPVFPSTRPNGIKGKLRHKDFVYEEYYNCYLCPEHHAFTYHTTTSDGYREAKSDSNISGSCPFLGFCSKNQNTPNV
ncbi:IS5/IS1182 family transposase, partial [Streptococcus thoraltensis]